MWPYVHALLKGPQGNIPDQWIWKNIASGLDVLLHFIVSTMPITVDGIVVIMTGWGGVK